MGSHSSRSSTETSPSIWRRSRPTRTAWWSFVTRCDVAAGDAKPPQEADSSSLRSSAANPGVGAERIEARHSRVVEETLVLLFRPGQHGERTIDLAKHSGRS